MPDLGLLAAVTEARVREVIELGSGRIMLVWPRETADGDGKELEAFADPIRPVR